MRFRFDEEKNRRVKEKHGVSLEEAQEIFDQAHLIDQKNDDPEQFRAIGWSGGRLCSAIFEIRRDRDGEYCHLITAWKATKQEEEAYAEQI
ncbi:MAG TPA: BrnT family toxin [Bryobacteraceae bacterium]|nr:BrnT family toxin [Bryobacteraceae bacterium]HPT27258.1 BrnT family toxin [Bryobacteraceae bacterium]